MKLHLEINERYGGYLTPSLTRVLEQAARCATLDQAEYLLQANAPRTWWAVARKPRAVVVSHIWQGREPVLCALIVQRAQ
jgi:hypothetical protein